MPIYSIPLDDTRPPLLSEGIDRHRNGRAKADQRNNPSSETRTAGMEWTRLCFALFPEGRCANQSKRDRRNEETSTNVH